MEFILISFFGVSIEMTELESILDVDISWCSDLLLDDFLVDLISIGVKNVYCTDISKDGMLSGPDFELYDSIMKMFPDLNLIASG